MYVVREKKNSDKLVHSEYGYHLHTALLNIQGTQSRVSNRRYTMCSRWENDHQISLSLCARGPLEGGGGGGRGYPKGRPLALSKPAYRPCPAPLPSCSRRLLSFCLFRTAFALSSLRLFAGHLLRRLHYHSHNKVAVFERQACARKRRTNPHDRGERIDIRGEDRDRNDERVTTACMSKDFALSQEKKIVPSFSLPLQTLSR